MTRVNKSRASGTPAFLPHPQHERDGRTSRRITSTGEGDLESALRFIMETMMLPRLDAIAQAIGSLAPANEDDPGGTLLYRLPDILKLIGISKSTWYAWSNPKSPSYDPLLPQAIKLGDHPRSPAAWRARDVEIWIEARARASRLRAN